MRLVYPYVHIRLGNFVDAWNNVCGAILNMNFKTVVAAAANSLIWCTRGLCVRAVSERTKARGESDKAKDKDKKQGFRSEAAGQSSTKEAVHIGYFLVHEVM